MIFPYYYLLLHSQNYRFQIFTMLITGSQQREQRSHTSVSLHTGYAHIKRRIRFRSPSRTRIQRNATNRSRLLEEGICPEGQGVTKPCQLVLKNGSVLPPSFPHGLGLQPPTLGQGRPQRPVCPAPRSTAALATGTAVPRPRSHLLLS